MLKEQLLMALDSLRANKFRSLLTMLGIIIGAATLVAVLSLGNALQGQVFERFIDLGTRAFVRVGDPQAERAGQAARNEGERRARCARLWSDIGAGLYDVGTIGHAPPRTVPHGRSRDRCAAGCALWNYRCADHTGWYKQGLQCFSDGAAPGWSMR